MDVENDEKRRSSGVVIIPKAIMRKKWHNPYDRDPLDDSETLLGWLWYFLLAAAVAAAFSWCFFKVLALVFGL